MFTDVQILVNTFETVSEEVDDAGTKEGERRGGDTRSVSKIYLFHLPPLPLLLPPFWKFRKCPGGSGGCLSFLCCSYLARSVGTPPLPTTVPLRHRSYRHPLLLQWSKKRGTLRRCDAFCIFLHGSMLTGTSPTFQCVFKMRQTFALEASHYLNNYLVGGDTCSSLRYTVCSFQ